MKRIKFKYNKYLGSITPLSYYKIKHKLKLNLNLKIIMIIRKYLTLL